MKVWAYIIAFTMISVVFMGVPKVEVQADQIIMLDMAFFVPEMSEYILDVEEHEDAMARAMKFQGNVWDMFADKNALGGFALGSPGDANFDSNFPLVYKLPVDVKAGEGNRWKMWARLNKVDDPNSFYWQVSQDGNKWTPPAFNIDSHGWNNPAGQLAIPKKAPWFWFAGVGTPALEPGENFIAIAGRESDPFTFPLIDVVMIRNDGEKPTDEDAEKLLAEQYAGVKSPLENIGIPEEDQAVDPGAKLTTVWGRVKSQ